MTKQEIKDLVAAKLVGQGNQVDLGSALPAILDGIIDLIRDPAPSEVLVVKNTDLIADTPDWQTYSIIKVDFGDGFVTILPVSTMLLDRALYQYQSEWRIADDGLDIDSIDEWGLLCDFLDAHSKPVAVQEGVTIQLTGDLDTAADVTSQIPDNYSPKTGDKIIYNGATFLFGGATIDPIGSGNTGAEFGYSDNEDEAGYKIILFSSDSKWMAVCRIV